MRVGLIGATGMVGQHYLHLLQNHPWFELTHVAASKERTEEPYPQDNWFAPGAPPKLTLDSPENPDCDLLFLAADCDPLPYVENGIHVVASSSLLRKNPQVPVIIPEINGDQEWPLRIACKPNCAVQSFLLPLWPLHRRFGIERVTVTTLQSLSGGGLSLMNTTNPNPFIPGEEEKCESEPFKIFGTTFPLSVSCHRVSRPFGHTAQVSVAFHTQPTREQILDAWNTYPGLDLPTAPKQPIRYIDGPLPLDPMSVTVNRLHECPALQWRFTALSHNVIRGAAGGGLLIAEQWYQREKESPLHSASEELPVS